MRRTIPIAIAAGTLIAVSACGQSTATNETSAPEAPSSQTAPESTSVPSSQSATADAPESTAPADTSSASAPEGDSGLPVIEAGTYLVPSEVPYGVYRVVGYWETMDAGMDTIENDGVYGEDEMTLAVITKDAEYVEFSEEAVPLADFPAYPVLEIGPKGGTYLVGPDIAPGRYRVTDRDYAYAARLDETLDIIDNEGNSGSVIIVVKPTDFAVEFSGTIEPL